MLAATALLGLTAVARLRRAKLGRFLRPIKTIIAFRNRAAFVPIPEPLTVVLLALASCSGVKTPPDPSVRLITHPRMTHAKNRPFLTRAAILKKPYV